MSSHLKIFKLSVVAIIVCVVGVLLLSNVAFDTRNGFTIRGNTELTWESPAESDVGTPLNSLTGYTIHCWNSIDRTTRTIAIEDPAVTSYELDDLWPGDYQCAISANLNDGRESALSNVVTRSVP